MAHERIAGFLTKTGDDVEHTRGQNLACQLRDLEGRDRGVLGRLHHHRVAGHERCDKPAARKQCRVVEGNDAPDDPEGLKHRVIETTRITWERLPSHLQRETRQISDEPRGDARVLAHLTDRRAVLGNIDMPQHVGVLLDQSRERVQRRHAFERRGIAPGWKCVACCANGALNVLNARSWNRGQYFTGRGIDRLKCPSVRGSDLLTAHDHRQLRGNLKRAHLLTERAAAAQIRVSVLVTHRLDTATLSSEPLTRSVYISHDRESSEIGSVHYRQFGISQRDVLSR